MPKLTIRLTDEDHAKIKDLSERNGQSVQYLVSRAIENYLRLRGAA